MALAEPKVIGFCCLMCTNCHVLMQLILKACALNADGLLLLSIKESLSVVTKFC